MKKGESIYFPLGKHFLNEEEVKYIEKSSTYLERYPLEKAARNKQLFAYKHKGFWQCMDTKRDKDNLEFQFRKGKVKF